MANRDMKKCPTSVIAVNATKICSDSHCCATETKHNIVKANYTH